MSPGREAACRAVFGTWGFFRTHSTAYSFYGLPVAQTVKILPAMQETWVQSLGREDPLEKEMATHSGTLAWRITWTE